MDIFQEYFQKYRYSLRSSLGLIYISEPINWNEDNKTFKRSLDVHGVFSNLSSDLEFYVGDGEDGGGYNYLKRVYETMSVNTIVLLVKEENISGIWSEIYRGYFDFSTYVGDPYKISIKFNESGLYEKIKARQSEELEVDRLTTMDGEIIEPLTSETVTLDGRKILIISELNETRADPPVYLGIDGNDGEIRLTKDGPVCVLKWGGNRKYNACVVPMTMVAEQSGNVQTISDYKCPVNTQDWNIRDASSTAAMFYDEAPNKITIKLDIDIQLSRIGNTAIERLLVQIVKYGGPLGLTYVSQETIIDVSNPVRNQNYSYKNPLKEISLEAGQSLSLILHLDKAGTSNNTDVLFTKSKIVITDETYSDPTEAKFIMPFEALDRIINIITNRPKRLLSSALGRIENGYNQDGFASLTGLTNGFWVRQFNTNYITTSFSDFIDSFKAVWQLGYGIEKIGFDENIRVEHISYFYQEVVTIKLNAQPSEITRKCAKDYFYSSITVGYREPSGKVLYEEVLGLDEYNIKNVYTTPITRIENKLINESKYRADSYGTEFARRKPKAKYPEEDTRYDLSVMILDLKRSVNNVFQQRKWADDFVVPVPFNRDTTGVYSPETATNLRFSPINTLKRMGYWIKGGFMKNLNEYVRYSSSNGNSKLVTNTIEPGGFESYENGNILCSDLNKNLFNPEIISFKFQVSSTLMKQVTESVIINGTTIMNYYGLVEFINEYNQYEYGFLMSLEPNKEGNWELLSSTKRISDISDKGDCKGYIVPPINLEAYDITP